MVARRARGWAWFVVALVATAVASVVATLVLGWPFLFLLFLLPFVWWGGRPKAESVRLRCPACGYAQRDASEAFCPRDGSELRSARTKHF